MKLFYFLMDIIMLEHCPAFHMSESGEACWLHVSLRLLLFPLLGCEGLLFKGMDLFQLLHEAGVHHPANTQHTEPR